MRILAIRGENLASLAAPFEIDLTAEPLAGAGLFAITGETGAGKSTILDALCLALYGEYPRVAVNRREDVPDPSGDMLTVKDPRNILRRGASSGYAEVDFIGQDGHGYRVRWEARRARGKATGKPQKELRSLVSLENGSAVATGKQPVLEAIESRTDLNFDQFRRTVLLAQGEFDAFLLAAESERAELLEKITGTEIYARISKRIHEGTAFKRGEVERLEERRAAIGLLDDAGREAIIEKRGEIGAHIARKESEKTALAAKLELAGRIAAARKSLAQAEQDQIAARENFTAAEPQRALLLEIEIAEPLRSTADAELLAGKRVSETEQQLQDAGTLHGRAKENAAEADETLAKAVSANREADGLVQRFEPIWRQAETLDTQIILAKAEFKNATEVQREAEEKHLAFRQTRDAVKAQLEEAQIAFGETQKQLAARERHALLADRAETIATLLQKREICSNSLSVANDALKAGQSNQTQLQKIAAELNEKLAADRAEQKQIEAQLSDKRSTLAAIDQERLSKHDMALVQLSSTTRNVEIICARYVEISGNLARAQQDKLSAQETMETTALQLTEAHATLEENKARRSEIASQIELADETLSREAIHLRSLLIAEEPCPVCGSKDHPHTQNQDSMNALVAQMRQRRVQLDDALKAASDALTAARGMEAKAQAQKADAAKRMEAAQAELTKSGEAYAAQIATLGCQMKAYSWNRDLPDRPSEQALAAIAALQADITTEREELAKPLAQAQSLRAELDGLQRAKDMLAQKLEHSNHTIETRRAELHRIELAIAQHKHRREECTRLLADIDADLRPFLDAAELTHDALARNGTEAARHLAELGESYHRIRDCHGELEKTLHQLNPQIATAKSACETAEAALKAVRVNLEQRQQELTARQDERTQLLGGEATDTHRKRILDVHKAARGKLEAAQNAHSTAKVDLAAATSRCETAAEAAKAAGAQLAEIRQSFETMTSGLGFSVKKAKDLLGISADIRKELRERLDIVTRMLAEAEGTLANRREDLTRLLPDNAEEIDIEAIRTAITALAEEINDLRQDIGAISQQLKSDDEARKKTATLSGEIEVAKNELAIWQDVNGAIGSADGSAFRRFAQGITLDHLTQLANDHLASLAPRYRLARSSSAPLILHVIDRDMGGEVRAARSLSGGERFLVSLALALSLSGLEGRQSFVDTLFIDEGFGSLDAETLDIAIDALETLHGTGRKVGLITHVAAMIDRIAVQIRVEKRGNGRSAVRIGDQSALPSLADMRMRVA